ncbi:MAG: glycosyltransferase family 4 protein [Akkermansiaceae bacterium]
MSASDQSSGTRPIILSAYACEPNRGSEPEVGWRVALEMAKHGRVIAITRANNRKVIEAELAQCSDPRPEFVYYDLPAWALWVKKKFSAITLYYVLWQVTVPWVFRKLVNDARLIHHVTFNGFQLPGVWIGTSAPILLGPLGGGMTTAPDYLPLFGKAQRTEQLRTLMVRAVSWMPWWRLTMAHADRVLAANEETRGLLDSHAARGVGTLLETGICEDQLISDPVPERSGEGPLKVIWLGNLMPRKSPELAIRALQHALEGGADVTLTIAGDGVERERVEALVAETGMEKSCRLIGRVPKENVTALMDDHEAFLFTSVRDTSGNVVLEAMSRALPVITIQHQGVAEICDAEGAELVPPGTISETVKGLGQALSRLAADRNRSRAMGLAGRERIRKHFTWVRYGREISAIYQQLAPEENQKKN